MSWNIFHHLHVYTLLPECRHVCWNVNWIECFSYESHVPIMQCRLSSWLVRWQHIVHYECYENFVGYRQQTYWSGVQVFPVSIPMSWYDRGISPGSWDCVHPIGIRRPTGFRPAVLFPAADLQTPGRDLGPGDPQYHWLGCFTRRLEAITITYSVVDKTRPTIFLQTTGAAQWLRSTSLLNTEAERWT